MASNSPTCEVDPPRKIEGWLNVWEVDGVKNRLFDDGATPLPIWEPHYCLLLQGEKRLSHHRTEKAAEEWTKTSPDCDLQQLRIDGGKKEFDKRWGYETLESIKENSIHHSPFVSLDIFNKSHTLDYPSRKNHSSKDSSYEKSGLGERRGSVPVVSSAVEDNMDTPSTPSRLANFFSKKVIKSNLKRTKSVTKLDRRKPSVPNELEGGPKVVSSLKRTMSLGRLARRWNPKEKSFKDEFGSSSSLQNERLRAVITSRMRTSRSHESLLVTSSAMHSIDLTAVDVEIKPLHSSILGQDHCFQVSTSNGSKYYSCRTAQERQKWIQCLRKTIQPTQEKTKRTDNSLKLWIQEAKNVPAKKRYFCELCLDKTLYARTSSKQKNDMLFWGEQFDFNNLPSVETVTVNIYKEPDKKKKKEKNQLLGYIHIPVSDISSRQYVEKWYTASSAVVGKAGKENKGELPLIRIKARYQTVHILPMDTYHDLIQYIQKDYMNLVEVLEPQISVKTKDEIATTMVNILQKLGKATDFLSDIVMAEVDKLDNENLTFRGNSIPTKAMEAYMKLVGEKYLQDTLGDFIRTILEASEDCEVDPTRVPSNTVLQRQQTNLVMYCEMVWFKIMNSSCFFPSELKEVFASLKERCEERKRQDVSDHLISACIFLRFLCPAVLSPSMFNLTQEFPQEKPARSLTLIAKTIQNLANFTKFGGKEEYMTFMNDFVDREFSSMRTFLQQISTDDNKMPPLEFDGFIDLGKELSILHSLLVESLEKMNEASESKLGWLRHILADVTDALENPQDTLRKSSLNHTRIYDNINTNTTNRPVTNGNVEVDPNANMTTGNMVANIMRDYQDNEPGLRRVNNISPQHNINSDNKANQNSAQHRTNNVNYSPQHRVTQPHHRSHQQLRQEHNTVVQSSPKRTIRSHSVESGQDYLKFSVLKKHPVNCSAISPENRRHNREGPSEQSVNQSWNKMVTAAELVNGDFVDLISFMDENHEDMQNSSAELDNGSQVSIGPMSTIASSGYQSFGYSQSSSPIDAGVQTENTAPLTLPVSFANPLFQHLNHSISTPASQHRDHQYQSPSHISRVTSSSSLSSDDGACSSYPMASSSSTNTRAKANNSSSHNSSPYHTYHPYTHDHKYARSLGDVNCVSKLSTISSSSSSESLTKEPHQQTRRNYYGSYHRMNGNRGHMVHSHSTRSANLPLDLPPEKLVNPALTVGELSKSVEFSLMSRGQEMSPPTGIKRIATDGVLNTGGGEPRINGHFGNHRNSDRNAHLPQNTVRMGVNSIHRKQHESEKSKAEYEQELNLLRQQLAETQKMLQEAQSRLLSHESSQENLSSSDTTWQHNPKYSDYDDDFLQTSCQPPVSSISKQSQHKDGNIEDILHRLISVEDDLRRDRQELSSVVEQKDQIIEAQEKRIETLDTANVRLLTALSSLKDRYQHAGVNGVTGGPIKLTLPDASQFKSSSC